VAELLGLIDVDVLAATARAITDRDTAKVLSIVNDLVSGGRDLRSFARGLVQYFRDLLLIRAAPELVELAIDREELSEIANNVSEDDVIRSIDLLTQLEGALRWAPEPRFHLEVALLKLAQLRHLASFEDLLARLEALESGSPPVPRSTPPVKAPSPATKPASTTKRATPKPSATTPSSLRPPKTPEPSEPSVTRDRPDAAELVARILDRLRSVNPKLHALLSHHGGVSLDGDCLRVGFDASQEFSRTELDREDLRSILAKAASECAGRTVRVEIASSASLALSGSPGSAGSAGVEPTPAPEPAPPKPDALRDKVLKEPLVRSFLETFQGEIEEIQSLETSPEGQSSERPDKR
jgi:DNA polymerase-3 subunit gamma/tau